MAAAAGVRDNMDRVVGAGADHGQYPTSPMAQVPGVRARIKPDPIRAAAGCGRGRADDADLAAIGVDQRRAVAACAEELTVRVDRQTARPAVAATHLDAPQEDQLAGLRVEDVDAPRRGAGVILGDRQVEEALL